MWIHHLDNKWTVRTSDILKGILSLYLLENRHLPTVYLITPVRPLLHACIQTMITHLELLICVV